MRRFSFTWNFKLKLLYYKAKLTQKFNYFYILILILLNHFVFLTKKKKKIEQILIKKKTVLGLLFDSDRVETPPHSLYRYLLRIWMSVRARVSIIQIHMMLLIIDLYEQ